MAGKLFPDAIKQNFKVPFHLALRWLLPAVMLFHVIHNQPRQICLAAPAVCGVLGIVIIATFLKLHFRKIHRVFPIVYRCSAFTRRYDSRVLGWLWPTFFDVQSGKPNLSADPAPADAPCTRPPVEIGWLRAGDVFHATYRNCGGAFRIRRFDVLS